MQTNEIKSMADAYAKEAAAIAAEQDSKSGSIAKHVGDQ
jgi:hypothetical protein